MRVQKSSGKLYWYGLGSDALGETDLASSTNNASFSEYIFFGSGEDVKTTQELMRHANSRLALDI